MKIFVNADDFGLHPIRDKAIVKCFRQGWLTTTTAMMNMPGLDAATQLAHDEKISGYVGLHLNLICGQPLTDAIKRNPIFCDREGVFNSEFHRSKRTRLWLSGESKRVVAEEVRAQIRLYLKHGYTLMHADSHQHAHNDWSVLPVVVAILKDHGFKSLRIARNMGAGIGLVKRTYKELFNSYLRVCGLSHSDYFGSIADFVKIRKTLRSDATVELMCHPMLTVGMEDREDGELTDFYSPFDERLMNEIIGLK